ncbi:MAG: hybrid sensor histidine kinase/response regulator, partial [Bacteroidales bacterium]|nr:hybrid sensor histidine kinase/response regulator [Bacteroidales bacterium]
MVIYIYNLRQDIDIQREHIEQYHHALALTNEFVFAVNQAQVEANPYVTSTNRRHWGSYREVALLSDSLRIISEQDSILNKIGTLLLKKSIVVAGLQSMFDNHAPVDSIGKRLKSIGSALLKDSLLVTTIVNDTIVHRLPKKGFWERVGEVFSPGSKPDSIVKVTTHKTDTVKLPNIKEDILSGMNIIAEEASKSYAEQLSAIEMQVTRLIIIDQEISSQITGLLHQLSLRTVNATLIEARKSAELIRNSFTTAIVVGSISLALILIFILMIISDVNKGKAARKALEEANARTRQIMESRHQLLLSVSHDIKTPLNSILGYLELWRGETSIPQEPLQSMQNSGKHIMALLENLLGFSSLEQGTLTPASSDFNLGQLCTETAGMFEPLARQKNLAFDCRFDIDKGLDIHSDALKIKQIIINLLSNSIKYASKGNVTFIMAYDGEKICFSISDTGAGIPADQMDALFKPFVRVDANKALAPGSGLGMYVVKGLVELLHGTIDVTSTVGEGTRTEVMIPARAAAAKTTKEHAKRILLVDDDPALLVMLTSMLAKLGHTVDRYDRPADFNPLCGEYDMVITDMEMGDVSGTDILRKIRDNGVEITVVMMTGRDGYSEAIAHEAGFDAYLHKPVTMHDLERLTGAVTSKFAADPGEAPAASGFALLEEMFDGDRQAIAEVLEVFVNTTTDNIQTLRQAVANNDFNQVQSLCHKMLPMFMQVDAPAECVEFLQQMDAARNDTSDQHPYWRGKTSDFTVLAGKLMEQIWKEYLPGHLSPER